MAGVQAGPDRYNRLEPFDELCDLLKSPTKREFCASGIFYEYSKVAVLETEALGRDGD